MKVTLEYVLPEDQEEFDMATAGKSMHCVLWDILQNLRTKIKHGNIEENTAYEEIQEMIIGAMDDHNVSL